jgi:hypothetical protein
MPSPMQIGPACAATTGVGSKGVTDDVVGRTGKDEEAEGKDDENGSDVEVDSPTVGSPEVTAAESVPVVGVVFTELPAASPVDVADVDDWNVDPPLVMNIAVPLVRNVCVSWPAVEVVHQNWLSFVGGCACSDIESRTLALAERIRGK